MIRELRKKPLEGRLLAYVDESLRICKLAFEDFTGEEAFGGAKEKEEVGLSAEDGLSVVFLSQGCNIDCGHHESSNAGTL